MKGLPSEIVLKRSAWDALAPPPFRGPKWAAPAWKVLAGSGQTGAGGKAVHRAPNTI
jgi:hypothetical protein